jgi:diguanylate cyclase (GGDEF)-like protein
VAKGEPAGVEPEERSVPAIVVATDTALRVMTMFGTDSTGLKAGRVPTGALLRAMHAALNGHRTELRARIGDTEFDGCVFPLLNERGEIAGAVAAGLDAAAFSRTEQELIEVREALRHAQGVASFAYYVVDLTSDMVTISEPFAQIWGLPLGTTHILYSDLLQRVHEEDREAFDALRRHSLESGPSIALQCRIVRPTGEIRYIRAFGSIFSGLGGEPERSVGSVFDFTDQMQAQNAVLFLSTHDPLTGLLNRHQLLEVLGHYADGDRTGALVIFDIDRFAQINEIAGHAVGDQLLRSIADRTRFLEADGHYVARLGSDEFACFLIDPKDRTQADERLQELRDALEAPFEAGHGEFVLRATMGIAHHPEDGTGETLLQNAGMALYAAKTAARGGVMRYNPALERKMSVRSRLERDLPAAIERSEFAMYYQPLMDAANNVVIATEALLRWRHPELGLLAPGEFLTIAEESEAVVEIGRWAIDRACRDAVLIRDSLGRDVRLNVNVSPRHVQSSKLVSHVSSALSESGWQPNQLQLEVTEQLLIEDVPSAVSTLEQLRDRGVSIAIDDFGTGYNTLSYLKSYPVSCLKIDRAFVKDAENDRYSRAICCSVAALADSLHMNVIGEGVETLGQADFLRTIGCRELQGFHFGQPVSAWDFMTIYGSEGVWLT